MKKITLSLLLLAGLMSCKKTTNVEVAVPTSGSLSYKLTDETGKGIPGVNINLHDLVDGLKMEPVVLERVVTDANGVADFGDLNPTTYYITADTPKVNNVTYIVKDYVQVLTGVVKQKSIKVTDFSGGVTLKFGSYYNQTPAGNIGILLVPFERYSSRPVSYLTKVADYKGTTSSAGEVTFKIPSLKAYTVVAYNLNTERIYEAYMNFAVTTNENKSLYYGLPL
jgi:hypothetical protein